MMEPKLFKRVPWWWNQNCLKEFLDDGTKNVSTQQKLIFAYMILIIVVIIITIIITVIITAFYMSFINDSESSFKGLQKLKIHLTK